MTEEEYIALHGEASLSTAAQHVLWRAGRLEWLMHRGQLEALQLLRSRRSRRYVLCFARRYGKTWFALLWAFMLCLSRSNARVPYAAPTAKMVETFAVPIAVLFANTAPRDLRPEVVGDEVRFPNGSYIHMQGCEDDKKADRLRGPKADGCVVDEGGFIRILDYVVRSVLLPQTVTTDGLIVIVSSPPTTPAHPFSVLASEAESRGAYMHRDIHSAPHLTAAQIAEYCEEAGGPKSATWLREGLARFVTDPVRAIVPEFSDDGAEVEIVKEIPRPEHFDAYVIGDLGFVDLTFVLFGYWHFLAGVIVIEDELVLERATSDHVQQAVSAIERERWGTREPYARRLDGTAREVADIARLQPWDPQSGEPKPAAWRGVNNRERDAAVNALRLAVLRRQLLIHPRCKVLCHHLRAGVWNEARSAFERSEGLGHFDGVAAAMYFVRHVDRDRNPYPAPVFDRSTHHVPPSQLAKPGWGSLITGPKRR